MKSGRAALRYAKALLDFSIEVQDEKNVSDEMQNIFFVMQSSKDLDEVLNNPILPAKQKRLIIEEVFNKSSNTTERLFDLLSHNSREGILNTVAQKYLELYDKHQGKVSAIVTTAVPLNEALEKKVLLKAAQLSPLKIELKNIIDPKIKGGFVLRVGDLEYNASIAERMETLKRELITS
tara:strand:- start:356 stop:892 length:537 start_codon:yes stop_codon:yes gene_type:complete